MQYAGLEWLVMICIQDLKSTIGEGITFPLLFGTFQVQFFRQATIDPVTSN